MEKQRLQDLFGKHIAGTLTEAEAAELQAVIDDPSQHWILRQVIGTELLSDARILPYPESRLNELETHVWARIDPIRQPARWKRFAVAASILLSVGLSWAVYSLLNRQSDQPERIVNTTAEDIMANTNQARLELSDGKTLQLKRDQTGIKILADGGIAYTDGTTLIGQASSQWAKMHVPRAAQYQLVLPDGTRVWINAGSTLRYPLHFEENERTVELEGEAYFEVAHDTDRPFSVKSGEQSLQVLGTSFNIQAYPEDATVATTLVEGKVALKTKDEGFHFLKPGQQAILKAGKWRLEGVNVSQYTSWKDGWIIFNKTALHTVLKQIERWYDVEFDLTQVPQIVESKLDETIYAELDRRLPLSKVLEGLEISSSYHYTLKERRIMVN